MITLTTLGCPDVTIDVAPAALEEAGPPGVQLELGLLAGERLVLTFTADEALRLMLALLSVDGGAA